MRVIAKPALTAFWTQHPEAQAPLLIWYTLIRKHHISNFAELKALFGSADQSDNFTIFNIGGNKYRLIARIIYRAQTVYIRNVLTHKDYDHWTPHHDPWNKHQHSTNPVSKQNSTKPTTPTPNAPKQNKATRKPNRKGGT